MFFQSTRPNYMSLGYSCRSLARRNTERAYIVNHGLSFSIYKKIYQYPYCTMCSIFHNVYPMSIQMLPLKKHYTRFLSLNKAHAPYDQTISVFPSIIIGSNGVVSPHGVFAEVQAQFLTPDNYTVRTLSDNMKKANIGVVAHYYMDAEIQGVLHAIQKQEEFAGKKSRIAIADSLAMCNFALEMCKSGVSAISCLGVDFMAESVAAIIDRNGFGHIPVYRASSKSIGCSLAESAETMSYRIWLQKGIDQNSKSLHVVYINTSLETKAISNSIIPTITCTSSNVMSTLLQASAEVPDIRILYGPDTYMGSNLITMLTSFLDAEWDDAKIARELHPQHNRESIVRLRNNIDVYPNGNCVVHHMFGNEVVNLVKKNYDDAFITAHLEVPGEMFEIAMKKSLEGKGVVGSTSDILKFISNKVLDCVNEYKNNQTLITRRLKFILGTEAGMVTSIVRSIQDILKCSGCNMIETEIVFPVSSEAVMGINDSTLGVVPSISNGEGCSVSGGCATCPFMKMNDLDALSDVVQMVIDNNTDLKSYLPPERIFGKMINEVNAVDLGSEPVMFMRHFMKDKIMPEALIKRLNLS